MSACIVCDAPTPEGKRFCSLHCTRSYAGKLGGPKPGDPIARFWAKVDRRGPDECWNWTGCLNNYGYGFFTIGRKIHIAHRYAYTLLIGEIPPGMHVCHRCDNPRCVNPAHAFLGTNADNNRDCREKGRHINNSRRLTQKKADVIIRRLQNGEKQTDLAAEYGFTLATMYRLASGKTHVHT